MKMAATTAADNNNMQNKIPIYNSDYNIILKLKY